MQHLLLPLTPRLAERLLEGERVWALLRSAYLAGAELGDQGADRGHGPAKAHDAEDESAQPSKEGRGFGLGQDNLSMSCGPVFTCTLSESAIVENPS